MKRATTIKILLVASLLDQHAFGQSHAESSRSTPSMDSVQVELNQLQRAELAKQPIATATLKEGELQSLKDLSLQLKTADRSFIRNLSPIDASNLTDADVVRIFTAISIGLGVVSMAAAKANFISHTVFVRTAATGIFGGLGILAISEITNVVHSLIRFFSDDEITLLIQMIDSKVAVFEKGTLLENAELEKMNSVLFIKTLQEMRDQLSNIGVARTNHLGLIDTGRSVVILAAIIVLLPTFSKVPPDQLRTINLTVGAMAALFAGGTALTYLTENSEERANLINRIDNCLLALNRQVSLQ